MQQVDWSTYKTGVESPTQNSTTSPTSGSNWSPPAASADDGNALHACEACDGRRWFRQGHPVGHVDFGKLIPCPKCGVDADTEDVVRQYASLSGLGAEQRGQSFQTFNPTIQADAKSASVMASRVSEWAKGEPGSFRWLPWLVLLGPPGIGKTHLAVAAMWRLARRREISMYVGAEQMADEMRNFENNAADIFKRSMIAAAWLILDDIGGVRDTNGYIVSVVSDVLRARHKRHAPTMLISNLRGDQLKAVVDIDDIGAVFDRLDDRMLGEVIDTGDTLTSVRSKERAL